MLEIAIRHRFAEAGGFSLDVEIAAPTPGVTVLFGPSGCGKSTILAAVAGLLRPQAGRIALNGEAMLDGRLCLPPEKRRCGVVFQEARLFPHLSVEGNLRYGLRRAPPERQGPDFEEVVALLGIAPLLARRPAALSGGEKQRVALGRALLARPRLLLMDEPLAALDAARKAELLPFLARLKQRLAIPLLYVTHAMEEVDRLADTLVLLEAGRVLAQGPVEALAARADLPGLAARRDAGALLACRVLEQCPAEGLTRLGFAGGELRVPLLAGLAPGEGLRLRLRARDIAVALGRPADVSVQNVLPAEILAIDPAGPHDAMLTLGLGPSRLLCRVTLAAVARLGLAPGLAVWAMIKSVALADGPEEG